jgi:DNA invertase Pin-like site-specific DNA recombinase
MKKEFLKKRQTPTPEQTPTPQQNLFFFGYTRVSSTQQKEGYSLTSQRERLLRYGVPQHNIFTDIKSGRNITDRENINLLLKKFNPENKSSETDIAILRKENIRRNTRLVVVYLDRISRNLESGLNLIKQLNDLGIEFVALDLPAAAGTDRLFNGLIFTIMLWVSEFMVRSLKIRQAEGIRKAQQNNKYSNRSNTKLTPSVLNEIKTRKSLGRSPIEIYSTLKISKSSYYKALKLIKKENKK